MTSDLAPLMTRLHDDLASTTAWFREVDAERRKANRRIEILRDAIRSIAELMEPQERDRHLLKLLDRVPPKRRTGPAVGRTERSSALMFLLATHPTERIRTTDVQRYLVENELASNSRAASRALIKKMRQGIVTRVNHGEYRINIDHPDLVRVRRELQSGPTLSRRSIR
ncbi:MAG: hypothetical protein AAGD13_05350 [Pseudomonadota bacterium]